MSRQTTFYIKLYSSLQLTYFCVMHSLWTSYSKELGLDLTIPLLFNNCWNDNTCISNSGITPLELIEIISNNFVNLFD